MSSYLLNTKCVIKYSSDVAVLVYYFIYYYYLLFNYKGELKCCSVLNELPHILFYGETSEENSSRAEVYFTNILSAQSQNDLKFISGLVDYPSCSQNRK